MCQSCGMVAARAKHGTPAKRARSSAGEHLPDTEGVTGSIPVAPTIRFEINRYAARAKLTYARWALPNVARGRRLSPDHVLPVPALYKLALMALFVEIG